MTTATAQVRERAAGWAAGAREIAVGLAVFAIYLLVTHGLAESRPVADAHGRWLLHVEDWLHVAVERPLNHALAGHAVLGALASWEYAITYVVTTFGVLAWVWWRRPDAYPWARNTLIISTLIAIACFAFWPATPPRLLSGTSFVDIVSIHHPPGSWGSGTVSAGADQLAAMPSLHIGWAMWVTAVTLRSHASPTGVGLGGLHLLVTALVVLATANHYLLDVVAGVALVAVTIGLESVRAALLGPSPVPVRTAAPPRRRAARARAVPVPPDWQRVAAEDAFFLYVESAAVPQHVGGIALLAGAPTLEAVRGLVSGRLARLPRLTQRVEPPGRLRRPRWTAADEVDLDWHVQQVRLGGGGRDELNAFVARVAEQRLDRARPLWRLWLVHEVGPGESAVVVVLHHAIADGLGVVDILRQLLDPVLPLPGEDVDRRPGVLVRAAATAAGLGQLASDGFARRLPVNAPLSGRRAFRTLLLPLPDARAAARAAGTRVTDLLLAAVGDAMARTLAADGDAAAGPLRAAVPMTLRPPAPPGTGRRAVPGNLTAALRLDVPLEPMPVAERLRRTAAAAESRRRSGRPLASAAVMRLLGLLPPAWHAALARTIYRSRFFTVIATNMPGPDVALAFAGADLLDVYPLVPMADEVPLAVGTLGWNGRLCVSLTIDPARLADPDRFTALLADAFAQLGIAAERGTTSSC